MFLFLSSEDTFVTILILVLAIILAFTLGWNNSGLTTGALSNLVQYGVALGITLLGILVGLFAEGSKMSQSILGNLIPSNAPVEAVIAGLAASVILFLLLTMIRIPVSLSNCVVGAFVGVALSGGLPINGAHLTEIVISWFLAPFFCVLVSIAIYEIIIWAESSRSLVSISWANRIVLLVSVFYISYALGANNLGLILSFIGSINYSFFSGIQFVSIEVVVFLAFACAAILFGRAIAKVIGDKFVVLSQIKTLAALLGGATVIWTFTQFSVPVSMTQVVIGGMLGAGLARGPTIINKTEVATVVRDWGLVTVFCAGLGYALETVIRFV